MTAAHESLVEAFTKYLEEKGPGHDGKTFVDWAVKHLLLLGIEEAVPKWYVYRTLELDGAKRMLEALSDEPAPADEVKYFHQPDQDCETFQGGPFDTEEAAIAEGRREYADQETFVVGVGRRLRADMSIRNVTDLDWFLTMMKDDAFDNGARAAGSEVFEVATTRREAEAALKGLLMVWARHYLRSEWYVSVGSREVPVVETKT